MCVCLSGSHTFVVVTHSYVSQATHAFLGMLPLYFFFKYLSIYRENSFLMQASTQIASKSAKSNNDSLLPCWIGMIFPTICVHDPRVCHDLDIRSYLQGQGHSSHITEIHVRPITLYRHVGFWGYFTQLHHVFDSRSYCQGQGHSSYIEKFFFWVVINLTWVAWMGMILHKVVVHDTEVIVAGGICPIGICFVVKNAKFFQFFSFQIFFNPICSKQGKMYM